MKKNYALLAFTLILAASSLQAQNNIFSQSIHQVNVNLRGAVKTLGQLTVTLPADGYVVVHFDGECYASIGDLIVVAASSYEGWNTNDGNVSIENSKVGFGRPFSHTRVYDITAGSHTFYAVGQNYVELDGSGSATIYGTLTVEYFPNTSPAIVKSNGFTFNGDVTDITAVGQQTIHATGPGKILVRFDGWITSSPADRIVLAASNSKSWGFDDGAVAVEAVNAGDVDENSFSHTRSYSVNSAGDYTYFAVAQVYGKAGGNGQVWIYGNLLVEFYPTSGSEKVFFSGFSHTAIDLNGEPTALTTITYDAPEAGKVLAVLDGYFTADPGYDVVLAASNDGNWSEDEGSLKLQALDLDQNRYSFSHSRLYNVGPGSHTFYAVGEIFGGSGGKTADLFGHLIVKYIPFSTTAVEDVADTKNEFEIFPNPAKEKIHLAFKNPDGAEKQIQLLNIQGQRLSTYQKNMTADVELDVSAIPTGIYWINIEGKIKSFIKQ